MVKTAMVEIDGEQCEIKELPARKNAEWRQKFEAAFSPLLEQAATLSNEDISTPADLVRVVRQVGANILPAIGQLHPLCVAYDERFEAAYESECADALPEVLRLAYPLAGLAARVGEIVNSSGLAPAPTSQSSPLPSGAPGTTS